MLPFFLSQDKLGQKIIRSQTLFQCWHSSLDPQNNLVGPPLGWKTVYVRTLHRVWSSKFWQPINYIFRRWAMSNIIGFQTVSLWWNFCINHELNWIISWLCSETIYVESIHREILISMFDNVSANFFGVKLGQRSIIFRISSNVDTPP